MTHRLLLVIAAGAAMLVLTFSPGEVSAQPGIAYDGDSFDAPRRPLGDSFVERTGWTMSASIGRGRIAISCDICDNVEPITEALSLSAHFGKMITPRIALITEHWTVRYNDRGSDFFNDSDIHLVAQRMQTVGAQVWVTRRLFVRGAVGVGWHISDSHYAKVDQFDNGERPAAGSGNMNEQSSGTYNPAATFAVGFEWAHTPGFAADIQFRVGTTKRPDDAYEVHNTGLNFGFSWY